MKRRVLLLLLALHLLPSAAADRDPLDVPMREWLLVFLVSLGAGGVSWVQKVRLGHAKAHDLTYLIGELACSVLAGMVVWALFELANAPKMLTIAMVAISGHLGAKAVALLERWGERQIQRLTGADRTDHTGV